MAEIDRMWQRPLPVPNNSDIDKAYWFFWSKIHPGAPVPFVQNNPNPQIASGHPLPESLPPPLHHPLPTHLPPYIEPDFWAVNFNLEGEICGLYYKTWTNIADYTVDSLRLVVITGISYEAENLPDNEVFQIQILRDGDVLETFEDIKINSADPNPAKHFALGGHFRPTPFWARIDHDQQIVARIKVLGPEGPALDQFQRTDADFVNCGIKILLHGFRSSLRDTRAGLPRPVDDGISMDVYGRPMFNPRDIEAAMLAMRFLGGG